MKWTETTPCTGGVQWEAYPTDTHAIDIWPHEKEGFSWCVITDDVDTTVPEGWSATVEDAKRHAEQAYYEWLDVMEGRKPIPDIVAAAVAKERDAVVTWLREKAEGMPDLWAVTATAYHLAANTFEDGEHRRKEKP